MDELLTEELQNLYAHTLALALLQGATESEAMQAAEAAVQQLIDMRLAIIDRLMQKDYFDAE